MFATRLVEKPRNAEFMKSDSGLRSYRKAKISPDRYYAPGTAVAQLTATGFLVPYDNVGADGSETLFGFLVDEVRPGFEGEFEYGAVLHREAEVFADRVPYPQVLANDGTVDAVATAALKVALLAEAAALEILFR